MVDVSRNVVAVLLLLVIAVSAVSTYYALWGGEKPVPTVTGQQGQVNLEIVPREIPLEPSSATGRVVLSIQRPEGR